jgi:hypothetical protein
MSPLQSAFARLAVSTLAIGLSGCSLLEKEFETGHSVESELNSEGLTGDTAATEDSGSGEGGGSGRPGEDGTDPDDGSGSGSDGTTDSGGSDGGDAGSDGTTDSGDTGEPPRVDCNPGAVAPTGNIDTCVSAILTCGSSVVATTQGGNSVMTADDYLAWYCTPFPDGDYAGSERTYNVTVPAGRKATFTLDSPCDDLDIFALRWELWDSNEQCPDYGNSVIECEADDSRAGGEVEVFADSTRDTNYLVMIDGPNAEQVAFALDITCE